MRIRWTVGEGCLLLLLLVFVLLFCNGCWDKKELNQLALAQMIAIDYTDNQYQVTLQLILPGVEQETVTSENLWSMSGCGASVGEAIQQIALAAPRELYLDHLDLVLLGEEILQQGVTQALDYLLKENVLRRRTALLAVQGNAGTLLTESAALAKMDIFYIENLLKDQSRRVHDSEAIINAYVLTTYHGLQETLVIPQIKLEQGTQLSLEGAALVQQGKLIAWVDRSWLLGYYWFTGGKEIMTVSYEGRPITAEATIKKCSWAINATDPLQVHVTIHAKIELISGYDWWNQRDDTEAISHQIQSRLEETALQQITDTFRKAQEKQADVFRLGRWLYAWHPEYVQAETWPTQFASLSITIELDTHITAK